MQTIVIIGGGAGGLELATRLGDSLGKRNKARIVLVDRHPTHFWKPLLHTVASGKLDPQAHQIAYSAQAAEHGFQFICGEATRIDRTKRCIHLAALRGDDGGEIVPARTLPYDRLVLAFGAVTNFYGVPGAARHCLTLDSVEDAETFRRRFLLSCMQASARAADGSGDGRVDLVIVGGGATGVELAAELNHTVRTLARYNVHSLDPAKGVRIRLLERGERLLPHLNPALSRRATRHLQRMGIEVCTGTAVASVEHDAVIDGSGVRHPADMSLWAAGVEAPALCTTLGLPLNRIKQIIVTPSLQTVDDPNVFAIGDCASHVSPASGIAVPPRAQVAHQQAMFLAEVLARPSGDALPHFRYRDYGSLVSLGPFAAVGVLIGGLSGREMLVGGTMARLMYGMLYHKHVLSLRGFARTVAQGVAHWIRTKITPPVRLH
ncbi:NAD(P)/FAD-dependent oxidoreductase [Noviherbaspirillum galbum]|uniref:NAD(P)/FAD-dependent oxidoreductase n=1 Tax=Noviherbaspirillum galbum TaxID=2709383 RepID=A0A6B3STR7_9BURK|nr:NAD(P)/FAD-dependent oxidoreductase [Noviherbaspirillum galbum]NEX64074.1 NAD(P)/FAD-dependent oxidoreductase [Noviherbaspirillum galbum]